MAARSTLVAGASSAWLASVRHVMAEADRGAPQGTTTTTTARGMTIRRSHRLANGQPYGVRHSMPSTRSKEPPPTLTIPSPDITSVGILPWRSRTSGDAGRTTTLHFRPIEQVFRNRGTPRGRRPFRGARGGQGVAPTGVEPVARRSGTAAERSAVHAPGNDRCHAVKGPSDRQLATDDRAQQLGPCGSRVLTHFVAGLVAVNRTAFTP